MADGVVVSSQSNGLNDTSSYLKERHEYEKIIKLRNEVFAGTHPRLRLPTKITSTVAVAAKNPPLKSTPQLPNGHTITSQASASKEDAHSKLSQPPKPLIKPSLQKPPNTKLPTTSTTGSSGLDPIFLTKSEDLVRAEMRLERQRIERALEEQVYQKKIASRQRISEQEAVPDFDVSDVLYQAQELVKPLAANEDTGANGTVSSSDSFDENTFYSSQINESTTEEVDEHPRRWKSRPCKYFFEGTCKKGDTCTFSHDPAFRQKLQGAEASTLDLESIDTSRHVSPRDHIKPQVVSVNESPSHTYPTETTRPTETEELPFPITDAHKRISRQREPYQEQLAHPASNMDRHDLADGPLTQQSRGGQRYDILEQVHNRHDLQSPLRNPYPQDAQRRETQISPSPPNSHRVRVVRNQITSPIAPQPARVSPLAVAKIPRLTQLQHSDPRGGASRATRKITSAQHNPNKALSPLNLRKRRRDIDPQEAARNVTARRELESPAAYIKEEPLSPPPFVETSSVQPQRYEQVGREPLIIDAASPQYREPIGYQTRKSTIGSQREYLDLPSPSTPVIRRVFSRAEQRFDYQDEPNIRRIVSARQPPRTQSPSHGFAQYPASNPHSVRAMSQSYIVHPQLDPIRQHRASVQPQSALNLRRDRSRSPGLSQVPYSSSGREAVSMAPPSRRIVVDQYGNRYYETPLPSDREASLAPVPRYFNDSVDSYEQSINTRPKIRAQFRDPYDEQGYIQRVASPGPTSPRYVEYIPRAEPSGIGIRNRTYQPRSEVYPDRDGSVRMVEYPDSRVYGQYEEVLRPAENITRMQSVQPLNSQYEVLNERAPRFQSVRPDRQRIVSLGDRGETESRYGHQVSVRADDGYAKTSNYLPLERPRYQYVSDIVNGRSANDELQDELLMEEAKSMSRRPIQRL